MGPLEMGAPKLCPCLTPPSMALKVHTCIPNALCQFLSKVKINGKKMCLKSKTKKTENIGVS